MKKSIFKVLALLCTVTTAVSFFGGCFGSETPTTENPPEVETPGGEEPSPEPEPEPEPVANVLLTDFETPFDRTSFTTYNYVNSYTDIPREDGDSAKVDYGMISETVDKTHVFTLNSAHGWEGPYWLDGGIDLPFKTDTFSFSAKDLLTDADIVETGGAVLYLLYNDEEGNRQEKPLTIDYENKIDISATKGSGWYHYTATLPDGLTTENVRCFEFKVFKKYYYVDNIYAINTEMEQPAYQAPTSEVICDFETDFQYVDDYTTEDDIEFSTYGYMDPNLYRPRTNGSKIYQYVTEQGNRGISFSRVNGYEGVYWDYPGYELEGKTKRFKVRVKGLQLADFYVQAYYIDTQGKKISEETVKVFESKEMANGWTEITFLTSKPALKVISFCFKTYAKYSYSIDDISAVYVKY